MDELFDEILLIQGSLNAIKSSQLFMTSKTTSRKCYFISKSVDFKCINVLEIFSFVLSIPSTSSYFGKVFGVM